MGILMHLAQINEIEKQILMYTLVKNTPFMYNEYEKGAIRIANGSTNYKLLNQKSNLTLIGAVAFLMFFLMITHDIMRYR